MLLYQQNRTMSIMIFGWSWFLKCFYISTEGAHDPGELCKYGYDCQVKGESESRGSHLNPNPRTNKQEPDVVCKQLSFFFWFTLIFFGQYNTKTAIVFWL